jgi:putative ABC transport system permease protein
VRAALGASRGRLVRQLLVESALLAVLAGALGLALSYGGVRLLSPMLPDGALPYWMTPRTLDVRVFAALAVVCIGSVFAFGLAPALLMSKRGMAPDLNSVGRGSTPGYRVRWWSTGLVGLEVGLSLVLVAAVAAAARTALIPPAGLVEPEADSLLTAAIALPTTTYRTSDSRLAFYDGLAERLQSSGVATAVAPATTLPLSGAPTMQVTTEGASTGARTPTALMAAVGEDYFEALGVPVRAGRSLDREAGQPGAPGAVVNERFVVSLLGERDPIGLRIGLSPPDNPRSSVQWFTIIGVAANVRQTPSLDPAPVVYVPFRAFPPPNAALLIRITGSPDQAVAALGTAVRSLDRAVSVDRVMTFAAARRQATWNLRLSTTLANGVTLIALVLALVGVHGLAAHVVVQRGPEIAIRRALGAGAGHVGRLVLRRLAMQLSVGLLAGALLLVVLRPIFQGIDDPLVLGASFVAIALAILAACAAPLRRAVATSPMQALRSE